ncbi:hypothetical protein AAFF_G00236180 [Aldrovandia affinis]|uniref:Uncharacterized protein n=1 Tax=Aldrovandia affinis TaxID=143900 RepID=A0AAD7W451_9TELE|nr:hypothetical protein AAFF_G00236180 [Aldrovandia affinis]
MTKTLRIIASVYSGSELQGCSSQRAVFSCAARSDPSRARLTCHPPARPPGRGGHERPSLLSTRGQLHIHSARLSKRRARPHVR